MDGLLLIDKQPDLTSHDVVQAARRTLGQRKIGHCGTLDPGATGLLVLTLGKATRLTRFLIQAPKVYAGHIRFGVTTDTYDAFGQVTEEKSIAELDEAAVRDGLTAFVGSFDQQAPPYSAKKHKGVKYYQLARQGREVPDASKTITVFEFEATGPLEEGNIPIRLSCTSGTYVRSLAHDLGHRLGVGAHLASLRRLQIGPFKVEDAALLGDIEGAEGVPERGWIGFDDIPLPFGEVTADAREERRITHGQTVLVPASEWEEGDWVKLVSRRRKLLAVGTVIERVGSGDVGVVQPRIVFR